MIETLRHRQFQSVPESLAVAIQSLPSKRHSLTIDIRKRSRSLSLRRHAESTAHNDTSAFSLYLLRGRRRRGFLPGRGILQLARVILGFHIDGYLATCV